MLELSILNLGLPATQKTTIIQINHLPVLCLVVRRGIKMLMELNTIQKMVTKRMASKLKCSMICKKYVSCCCANEMLDQKLTGKGPIIPQR